MLLSSIKTVFGQSLDSFPQRTQRLRETPGAHLGRKGSCDFSTSGLRAAATVPNKSRTKPCEVYFVHLEINAPAPKCFTYETAKSLSCSTDDSTRKDCPVDFRRL